MWVEQSHDAMVTGHTRSEKENSHATDEGVDVACTRPAVPMTSYSGVCACTLVFESGLEATHGWLGSGIRID